MAHEAEARGERVADIEARVGVQLVKLARERRLRDALDDGAEFVRDLFQTLDEDDLGPAHRARTPPRVLAQTRASLVVNLARGDDAEMRGLRLRLALDGAARVRAREVAVAHDEEERLAADVRRQLRLAVAPRGARRR